MPDLHLTWGDVHERALDIASEINRTRLEGIPGPLKAYPIPNGGVFAAQAVQHAAAFLGFQIALTENMLTANILIDDILQSGETMQRFKDRSGVPFGYVLVNKQETRITEWIVFPWERMQAQKDDSLNDNIKRILQFIGDDPNREGLRETPERVVRSFAEIYAGYKQDPRDVLKVFEDGSCDEMVVLKDCEFYSTCEHHMQPFFGRAHVAYLPDKRVIGVSKIARIVDIFARRLQIQERLTMQIADAIENNLLPRGVGVVLDARHFCMVCRGVNKQQSSLVTSALRGAFREPQVRSEFFGFIK